MITFNVKNDIAKTLAKFPWVREDQYAKLVSNVLNSTANKIALTLKDEMKRVFDRPTPYTLRSIYPWRGKPSDLRAEVRIRDFAAKGTPAHKFLEPEVFGGRRGQKSFEKALSQAGLLPAGMYAVPAKDSPYLDSYGNLRPAYFNQILSYVRANRDGSQNRGFGPKSRKNAKGKRFGTQFFVRKVFAEDGLPLGVYEKKGNKARMVIAFVKAPIYKQRLRYFEISERVAREYFPDKLRREAEYLTKTNGAQFKGEVLKGLEGILN